MRDQKLKKQLSALTVPRYHPAELEETIRKAKEIQFHPEKQRLTTIQFFQDQLRFVRKEFWGMKGILSLLLLYLLLSAGMEPDSWFWTFVAVSGPMLCLANVQVLCDVYRSGMLELQMTAKHSLRKVLMFRLLISGTVDLVVFAAGAVILILWKGVYLWQVFLYAAVPYHVMCLGCLVVLNCGTEENALLYCITWGIAVIFVMVVLKTGGYQVFEMENAVVWAAVGALTVSGVIRETKRLIRCNAYGTACGIL